MDTDVATALTEIRARLDRLEGKAPAPTPTPPAPTGGAYPAKSVSLYWMMWPTSGSPKLATINPAVNVVRLAFAQGSPPRLVGPASEGSLTNLAVETRKLQQRGVKVVVSIGGAQGHVNVADRAGFVAGIKSIHATVPLDGIDWDVEGSTPMGAPDVIAISETLKSTFGATFSVSMAPNGSNIGNYLGVAVELEKRSLLDRFGQQFYDAPVSSGAMLGRIDEAVGRGIKPGHYDVGMMIGVGSNWWTLQQCKDNYAVAEGKYPGLGGAYLWEAGRPQTQEWCSQVGALVKG